MTPSFIFTFKGFAVKNPKIFVRGLGDKQRRAQIEVMKTDKTLKIIKTLKKEQQYLVQDVSFKLDNNVYYVKTHQHSTFHMIEPFQESRGSQSNNWRKRKAITKVVETSQKTTKAETSSNTFINPPMNSKSGSCSPSSHVNTEKLLFPFFSFASAPSSKPTVSPSSGKKKIIGPRKVLNSKFETEDFYRWVLILDDFFESPMYDGYTISLPELSIERKEKSFIFTAESGLYILEQSKAKLTTNMSSEELGEKVSDLYEIAISDSKFQLNLTIKKLL